MLFGAACGGDAIGPDLTRPCQDHACSAGLQCVAVDFVRVCLLEIKDPSAMRPNGDPICPMGLGGFQTMSGTIRPDGTMTAVEHHALCSPLCEATAECSWGNRCLLMAARPETGGAWRGVCLP